MDSASAMVSPYVHLWTGATWTQDLTMLGGVAFVLVCARVASAMAARAPAPSSNGLTAIALGLALALIGAFQTSFGLAHFVGDVEARILAHFLAAAGLIGLSLLVPRHFAANAMAGVFALTAVAFTFGGYDHATGRYASAFTPLMLAGALPVLAWALLPWGKRIGPLWPAVVWSMPIPAWLLAQLVVYIGHPMEKNGGLWLLVGAMGVLMAREKVDARLWWVWGAAVLAALFAMPSASYDAPNPLAWDVGMLPLVLAPILALLFPLLDKRPPDWAIGLFAGAVFAGMFLLLGPAYVRDTPHLPNFPKMMPTTWWTVCLVAAAVATAATAWRFGWKRDPEHATLSLPNLLTVLALTLLAGSLAGGTQGALLMVLAFFVGVLAAHALYQQRTAPWMPPSATTALLIGLMVSGSSFVPAQPDSYLPMFAMVVGAFLATVCAAFVYVQHPLLRTRVLWGLALLWAAVALEVPSMGATGMADWLPTEPMAHTDWTLWYNLVAIGLATCVAGAAAWVAWKQGASTKVLPSAITAVMAVLVATSIVAPDSGDRSGYILALGVCASIAARHIRWAWAGWVPLIALGFWLLQSLGDRLHTTPEPGAALMLAGALVLAVRRLDRTDTLFWGWVYLSVVWLVESTALFLGFIQAPIVHDPCREQVCILHTSYSAHNSWLFHQDLLGTPMEWLVFLAFVVWSTGLSTFHQAQTRAQRYTLYAFWTATAILTLWMVLWGFATRYPVEPTAMEHIVLLASMGLLGTALWKGDRTVQGAALLVMMGMALYIANRPSHAEVATLIALAMLGMALLGKPGTHTDGRMAWTGFGIAAATLVITFAWAPYVWWAAAGAAVVVAAWLAQEKEEGIALLAATLAVFLLAIAGTTPLDGGFLAAADPSSMFTASAAIGLAFAGVAHLYRPQWWPVWLALGGSTAAFFAAHHTTGQGWAGVDAAMEMGLFAALMVAGGVSAFSHLRPWFQGTNLPMFVWMGVIVLTTSVAGAPNPVEGTSSAVTLGLLLGGMALAIGLCTQNPLRAHQGYAATLPAALAILMAVLAGLVATSGAAILPVESVAKLVDEPLALVLAGALVALAGWRLLWAPWLLAAVLGLAFAGPSMLLWPLVWVGAAAIWLRAHHQASFVATPILAITWAAALGGFAQGWWRFGDIEAWGWWTMAAGMSIALMGAMVHLHTQAPRGSTRKG